MKLQISILILLVILELSNGLHPYGQPVQLNIGDGKQKYKPDGLTQILLHPEVEDRKIILLSIIGPFRKGKSFFLDYCLRFLYANYKSINTKSVNRKSNWWGEPDEPLTGFSWKHGMKADTKGILIWSDVFLYETSREKIAIILMDTQGLFETGRSPGLDAKIFGITSFLSSIEIINLHGVIQEDQLEYLKMATDYSSVANKRLNAKSMTASSKQFQELMFLVQNFVDDEIGYGYQGGSKYKDEVFKDFAQNHTAAAAKSVREHIEDSFDKVFCVTLPHPGVKVTKKDYDGRWSILEDEFKEHLKNLISSLLAPNKLIKKKVLGNEVTGKELAVYAESIFINFQSPDLPNVESILDAVVKIEMEKMLQKLIEEYKNGLKTNLNYDMEPFLETLHRNHENLQKLILDKFKGIPKIADDNMEKLFEEQLMANTLQFFKDWKEEKMMQYKILQEQKLAKAEIERSRAEFEKMKLDFEEMIRNLTKQNEEKNEDFKAALQKSQDLAEERQREIDRIKSSRPTYEKGFEPWNKSGATRINNFNIISFLIVLLPFLQLLNI